MIGLITPTGDRPAQLKICERLMQNQTYTGDVVWVIVDDCLPRTANDIKRPGWDIIVSNPSPNWKPGTNTQGRNLSVGINILMDYDLEAIFIIEDDDYYRSNYLEKMLKYLNGFRVAGEVDTIYYNVYFRRYFSNQNTKHASLFQVAFTPEVIPIFRRCYLDKFIDAKFFELLAGNGVNLFAEHKLAVGIKGIYGRPGIGAGHGKQMNMRSDPNLTYLTNLIGTDAKIYERYYGNYSK